MPPPNRESEADQGVTTLELFFDLVFVFTITQLTAALQHDISVEGAVRVVLIFVILFWMYGGYVWLTNQVPPTATPMRLLLVGGMSGFLVCALAIPHAFGDSGIAFGVGYLAVVLVHGGIYARAYGGAVARFVPLNALAALFVIAAGFVDGPARYALWCSPLVAQYVASHLTRRVDESTRAGFDVRPSHFVERHGLLLIIVIGESVVAIGIGLGSAPLDLATYAAAVAGLVLAAALWWTYFGEDERRAEASLAGAALNDRVVMALGAYFYAYVPILLGVVTLAAGVKLTIADLGSRLETGPALLLGGGVALYLAGNVAFRLALRIAPIAYRVAGTVVAVATIELGVVGSGFAQLLALVATLVVMLVAEASRPATDALIAGAPAREA